jgi:hypothetical protein
MIPTEDATPQDRWRGIFRRAAVTTLRLAPGVWLLALMPMVFDWRWTPKQFGALTLVAIAMLPLLFSALVLLQLLPRGWYQRR